MTSSASLRRKMVEGLSDREALSSAAVRRAFLAVPRENFVPEIVLTRGLDAVYNDEAFVTKTDRQGMPISSSSQPGIMAPMLEHLALSPGHRVLEIGAGTGYNAALIRSIVGRTGRVTTLDIDGDTVARARRALRRIGSSVRVEHADGAKGWRAHAPYDRIVVTTSSAGIPRAWFSQLRPGGLLELPLRLTTDTFGPQVVVTLRKERAGLRSLVVIPGGFMTMRQREDSEAMDLPRIGVWFRANGKADGLNATGGAVRVLSATSRRRLAAVMAAGPRTKVVARGPGSRVAGALLYAALAAPRGVRVEGATWWSVGIVEPDGSGIAALQFKGEMIKRGTTGSIRMLGRGTRRPERVLLDLVEGWRSVGRPGWKDLEIEASYGRRPSGRWKTEKRGGAFLSFDWSTRVPRK